jgi:Na+/proline symporter
MHLLQVFMLLASCMVCAVQAHAPVKLGDATTGRMSLVGRGFTVSRCQILYSYFIGFFSYLTDKRRSNISPDALPALRRTPRVGEV